MNKTITVLMGALVLAVLGVLVAFLLMTGIDGFEGSAQDVGDQGCEFQRERAIQAQLDGSGVSEREIEAMDDNCKEGFGGTTVSSEIYELELENVAVIRELNHGTD